MTTTVKKPTRLELEARVADLRYKLKERASQVEKRLQLALDSVDIRDVIDYLDENSFDDFLDDQRRLAGDPNEDGNT